MSRVLKLLGRLIGFSKATSEATPRIFSNTTLQQYSAGDRVLINGTKLSVPLQAGSRTRIQYGRSSQSNTIPHDDIIGRRMRTIVFPHENGRISRIEPATLEQYISLTPRLVTPIYASYAATIVNLLDLHPYKPGSHTQSEDSDTRIEILESGTGHGSLTLHLARAIAAANPPNLDAELPEFYDEKSNPAERSQSQIDLINAWTDWRQTRRAIVHTVENVAANRYHAEKTIRGFRQGIYWPHVEFYVSDVGNWVQEQIEKRSKDDRSKEAFLDHVILDLPGVHNQISRVQQAMRVDAKLVAFTPSVTQIGDCVRLIEEKRLPLILDKVVELGEGISNGRKWDVRLVNIRKKSKSSSSTPFSDGEVESIMEDSAAETIDAEENVTTQENEPPVMICRPKVGERTIGGGFIGIWKKTTG